MNFRLYHVFACWPLVKPHHNAQTTMARLWRTAGLYLPFFCSLISGAESAQCSSKVEQFSVTTPDDVEDLISLMDCTGGGTFNVAWTGRIAIGQTIEVTGNNKLTITASSSASPSEEVGVLAAEPQTDGVLASNPDVRLFLVSGESATLSLNSLLLEGGTALNGGAVSALSSTPGGAVVNVVDCYFKHNKAAAFGGERRGDNVARSKFKTTLVCCVLRAPSVGARLIGRSVP